MIAADRAQVVDDYRNRFGQLPWHRRLKVLALISIILAVTRLHRAMYRLGVLKRPNLQGVTEELRLPRWDLPVSQFNLTEEQISSFERDGFVRPFEVLPHAEALELNEILKQKIMTGRVVYGAHPELEGEARERRMAEDGLRDDLEARGWNRHFNIAEIDDLMRRPEIVDRLASLYGPKVVLWRSQVFPVAPESRGSALHQVSDFSHATSGRELVPSEPMPQAMLNLSVWVALSDVGYDMAPLLMIRGSHHTDQFERALLNKRYIFSQLDLRRQAELALLASIADAPFARFDRVTLFSQALVEEGIIDSPRPEDVVTLTMKAGEAVIFTSKCIHGSRPNVTKDRDRFALGGRYTAASVELYPDDGDYYELNHFLPAKPKLPREFLRGVVVRE